MGAWSEILSTVTRVCTRFLAQQEASEENEAEELRGQSWGSEELHFCTFRRSLGNGTNLTPPSGRYGYRVSDIGLQSPSAHVFTIAGLLSALWILVVLRWPSAVDGTLKSKNQLNDWILVGLSCWIKFRPKFVRDKDVSCPCVCWLDSRGLSVKFRRHIN